MGERVEEKSLHGRVQSIDRAMMLLEAMGMDEDGNRLVDLATRTGLAPSTVHRILTTLERWQFIQYNPNDRMWHIGRQAFAIGSVFTRQSNLVASALPYLRRLRDQTRETANLGFVQDGEVVCVDRVESRDITRSVARVGSRVPMTASAMGKAILATYSQDDLETILLREGSRRFTANTLTRQSALRADLEKIRTDGYAIDDEELVSGLRCVASAVYDHHGEAICAISLSSIASRITPQRIPVLGRLLAETSAQLTAALSGEMPPVNAIAS
ncbi:IclR family transcriptional regulator [Rhizobium sp. 768_B6_N1_8]|jgi:IclR family acetate operon transcriptional repressor|uniref:IclR family transcriptional regulator n=1 Tax=unclassified Rhizobium TaxID=2613769 RepID=UPI003F23DF12